MHCKIFKRVLAFIIIPAIICGFCSANWNGRNIFAENGDGGELSNISSLLYSGKINGAITGEAGYYNLDGSSAEYLILPTAEGIYVVESNELKLFIKTDDVVLETSVIPDLDGDGMSDLVAVVRSEFFPNVRAYSSSTGSVLWSYKHAEPYYDVFNNISMEVNLSIFKVNVVIGDSAANSFVQLVSDYDIISLSAKDGKKLWEYKDRNNIWQVCTVNDINGNGYADIVFGNQLGEIKALDSKNGNLLWRNKIVQDFTVKIMNRTVNTISRSVWDIVQRDGSDENSIVVSGEDGFLYEINPQNGDIINKKDVGKFNEDFLNAQYENQRDMYSSNIVPTGIFHKGFFGLKLFLAEDVTGDGIKDFIATQNLGFSKSHQFLYGSTRMDNPEINKSVSLIDGNNLDILWTTDVTNEIINVDYTEPIIRDIDGEKHVLLPGKFEYGDLSFVVLKVSDGTLNSSLDMHLDSQIFFKETYPNKFIVRESEEGNVFLGIIDVHSIVINSKLDNVLIEFNDGLFGKYIKIDNNILEIQEIAGVIQYIMMHEGKTLNEIWKYGMEDTGVNGAVGFKGVIPIGDFNDDGFSDIFLQVFHNSQDTRDLIFQIISGKDGTEIYSFEVLNDEGNIFFLGDVNDDKFIDFLVIKETECYRMISEAKGGRVNYYKDSKNYKYDEKAQNTNYAKLIGDIDGDNIEDFFIGFVEDESSYVSVISGKTMEKIYDIKNYFDEYHYFTEYDFNGDGILDYIRFVKYTGEIYIVSGSNQENIFYIPLYNEYSYMHERSKPLLPDGKGDMSMFYGLLGSFITSVGDITGDGNPEYAIVVTTYKDLRRYIEIGIYDVVRRNNEPVKTFSIPLEGDGYTWEQSLVPLIEVKDDNNGKFILFDINSEWFLFDVEKLKPVVSFPAGDVQEAFIGDGVLTVFGSIYEKINTANDFAIIGLKSDEKTASPINLKWKHDKDSYFSVTKIFVDDVYSAISYTDDIVLRLRAGIRNIALKHTDESGKSYYSYIDLNISKSAVPVFFLSTASLTAVAVILLFILVPSARMKRVLKRRVRKDELPSDINK